jgi:hypothetical protein
MSSISTSNVTSGFIDLATFDEIEKYLYGGHHATAYFVRETRKATWFTQVPVVLSRASGSANFGQEWSVSISRAGDYLLQTWLRVVIPAVSLQNVGNGGVTAAHRIRWTHNLAHNLIRECCITFNDLVAARFDNYHLDFWSAFTVPASKDNGYKNMIGETSDFVNPKRKLPEKILNLPLPFFYSRDSGVALPTAALPYNEMRIVFHFRDWKELLILEDYAQIPNQSNGTAIALAGQTAADIRIPITTTFLLAEPSLTHCHVWANYAIVSNDERKRMACAPRDILIEQVQSVPKMTFRSSSQVHDIRFSHAIKVIFFAVRNTTWPSEWSNYTTASPAPTKPFGTPTTEPEMVSLAWGQDFMVDPLLRASVIYENTSRLSSMGSDFYSLVNPYFHAPTIPDMPGYHCYSYSLDFMSLDPMGSTNYGKLTNVSLSPEAHGHVKTGETGVVSAEQIAAGINAIRTGLEFPQKYEFILTAVSNNIIRVSGGALGFPVL